MRKNTFLIIIGVIIVGSAFYWYSYRPSHIRSQCLAEGELNPTAIGISDDAARTKFINDYYQTCLHRFGLDK